MTHELKYEVDKETDTCETKCPFNMAHPKHNDVTMAVGSWHCVNSCPLFIRDNQNEQVLFCDNPNEVRP